MTTEAEKRRDARLRRRYGITLQEYEELFASQGNVCALCHREKKTTTSRAMSVDHNHEPPYEVRGILCHYCNKYRVGNLSVDDAWNIYVYLTSPPATKLFGTPRRVPVGMEKGEKKRRRRTTVKRNPRRVK